MMENIIMYDRNNDRNDKWNVWHVKQFRVEQVVLEIERSWFVKTCLSGQIGNTLLSIHSFLS